MINNFLITIRFSPQGSARPDDVRDKGPAVVAYHRLTRELTSEFDRHFGKEGEIVVTWAPNEPLIFPLKTWVPQIEYRCNRWQLYFEVREWFRERRNETIHIEVIGFGASDPSTIVHARWVSLSVNTICADVNQKTFLPLNRYATACEKCLWPDLASPPNPYVVAHEVVSPRNAKQDLFGARNGIFVAKRRIADAVFPLIQDDIIHGDVEIAGNKAAGHDYLWFRPRYFLDTRWGIREEGKRCPVCGVAEKCLAEEDMQAAFLTDMGRAEWNIALLGRIPGNNRDETERWIPRYHGVVVSGGLFGVLYNLGIKHLNWPGILYGMRDDLVSIEPTRRFGKLFEGKRDKVLKRGEPDVRVRG